jgi:hypothetical protein
MTALRQRQPPLKSNKLRASAKGQECTLQINDVCNCNPDTTVLAHLQWEGGTMGGKANDYSACFACSACHDFLDQRRVIGEERYLYMGRAMARTIDVWMRTGVIKI